MFPNLPHALALLAVIASRSAHAADGAFMSPIVEPATAVLVFVALAVLVSVLRRKRDPSDTP